MSSVATLIASGRIERTVGRFPGIGESGGALPLFAQWVDRILDGGDFFRRIIGYLTAEFFFERHYKFDRVEAVRAKIVDKAGTVRNFRFVDAEMFNDNLLYAFRNVTHLSLTLLDLWVAA